jgi:hypothetical protein
MIKQPNGLWTLWYDQTLLGFQNPGNMKGSNIKQISAGGIQNVQIPSCIEDGDYLLRFEIIALHSAYNYPGAQFYVLSTPSTILSYQANSHLDGVRSNNCQWRNGCLKPLHCCASWSLFCTSGSHIAVAFSHNFLN